MMTIRLATASLTLFCFFLGSGYAKEPTPRQQLKAELDQLNASLKPLREEAYLEVDGAFRKYYEVLRQKMKKLDPNQAAKIEQVQAIRKQLYGEHSGSRAEDYMKKSEEK